MTIKPAHMILCNSTPGYLSLFVISVGTPPGLLAEVLVALRFQENGSYRLGKEVVSVYPTKCTVVSDAKVISSSMRGVLPEMVSFGDGICNIA